MYAISINTRGRKSSHRGRLRSGLTLIELLVVIGIVSTLIAILLPAVGKVRHQARRIMGISNLREIAAAANSLADDNDERYPPSVATIGLDDSWHWAEPTTLTAFKKRVPTMHRSVSAYLHDYIPDADVMFCPNAPVRHKDLQQVWDAGDDWDCPTITPVPDAMMGVYCLYWNYIGYLGQEEGLFRGPSGPARGYRQGSILVTEYLGYGHWRSPKAFGSCERFSRAEVAEGTQISSNYWSRPGSGTADELSSLDVKLHAGYIDGHVESYSPAETRPMRVILHRDTCEPYADELAVSPGIFYLPYTGVH